MIVDLFIREKRYKSATERFPSPIIFVYLFSDWFDNEAECCFWNVKYGRSEKKGAVPRVFGRESRHIYYAYIAELLDNCTTQQVHIIEDIVKAAKESLNKNM